jgi:hypothetical protein
VWRVEFQRVHRVGEARCCEHSANAHDPRGRCHVLDCACGRVSEGGGR